MYIPEMFTLSDPEAHFAWALQIRVDLSASQAAGEPVLQLLEVLQ